MKELLVCEAIVVRAVVSARIGDVPLTGDTIVKAKMFIPEHITKEKIANFSSNDKARRELAIALVLNKVREIMINRFITLHNCDRYSIEFLTEPYLDSE